MPCAGPCFTLNLSLLLLFVLACIERVKAQGETCKREWTNLNEPSPFLCSLSVVMRRVENCYVRVEETLTYPSTTGEDLVRRLQRLKGWQKIQGKILVERDGEKVGEQDGDVKNLNAKANEVIVSLPADKTSEEVVYRISYELRDGVLRFTDTCEQMPDDIEPDPNANLIRWRRGDMDESIDDLSVTFESTLDEGEFATLGTDNQATKEGDRKFVIRRRDVKDDIEIYMVERGTEPCMVNMRCYEPNTVKFWIPLLIALAVLVFVVVIITLVIWYRTRAKQKRSIADFGFPSM